MTNRWKFRAAYLVLAVLAAAIAAVTAHAVLRHAPTRHTTKLPAWWRGLSKNEIAVQLESGRAPIRPDGAGPLVPVCWPKGPRLCVVRAVSDDHLVLIYFQVIGDIWTIQHVESLNSGAGTAVPGG